MKCKFTPQTEVIGRVKSNSTVKLIEAEPMLFSCDWLTARELAGPLTSSIMDIIFPDIRDTTDHLFSQGFAPLIDTKSVMLMPSFYPCIGGWHCDAVPRPDGKSQPDLSLMREDVFHYLCIIPSTPNLSSTEFIDEPIEVKVDDNYVWRSVNAELEKIDKKTIFAEDGVVYKFSQPTIHRGQASTGHGWRYFFRLTFCKNKPANQIRHQVQVYTSPDKSW